MTILLDFFITPPLKNLEYDTKYMYEVGTDKSVRQFSFTTPPKVGPDVPYTFGIIGDLGQTYASNETLYHYMSNPKGQTILFPGDLAQDNHPNHDQRKWDTWEDSWSLALLTSPLSMLLGITRLISFQT
uniref:Purple acid phosphatase N-terminal domain-containing protein n=1 Tax=Brassica campestris TaxID=3711 RepID=A0A3P6CB26_BRACM|nr:unnamed protein product [Brassica rapa]